VVPCARCLEPVEFRPHIELSLLLQPASAVAPAPPSSPCARRLVKVSVRLRIRCTTRKAP
jgi:hypothetical protein